MCNDGSFVTIPPIPPITTDAYRTSVPRTHFGVARDRRPTVISSAGDRHSPEVSLFLEFDHDDADRARHVLRDVVAEAETRLEEIIDTQTARSS